MDGRFKVHYGFYGFITRAFGVALTVLYSIFTALKRAFIIALRYFMGFYDACLAQACLSYK